jgi:plastocyanin
VNKRIAIAAVAAAALLAPATAAGQANVNARAGNIWTPDDVEIVLNGEVTWNFDHPDNSAAHDVWLVPPGGDPDPDGDIFQVTSGPVAVGGPSVSHTFNQNGTWDFVCRLHSFQSGAGQPWQGMVGTVDVGQQPIGTDLRLGASPRTKTVKPGKQATFTATVSNIGQSQGANLRVCAKVPRTLAAIRGSACASFANLAAGASRRPTFTVKPKARAKGKSVRITFTATAANAPRETAAATLKVKRR